MKGHNFAANRLAIDAAVVFALFAVFTVSVIMSLLAGAGVYKSVAGQISESFSKRTAEAYIISKVRHFDAAGKNGDSLVKVIKTREIDALALYEEYEGGLDVTYIYWREGWLYELYTGSDDLPSFDSGERIIETVDFSVSIDEGLLSVSTGGKPRYIALTGGS